MNALIIHIIEVTKYANGSNNIARIIMQRHRDTP